MFASKIWNGWCWENGAKGRHCSVEYCSPEYRHQNTTWIRRQSINVDYTTIGHPRRNLTRKFARRFAFCVPNALPLTTAVRFCCDGDIRSARPNKLYCWYCNCWLFWCCCWFCFCFCFSCRWCCWWFLSCCCCWCCLNCCWNWCCCCCPCDKPVACCRCCRWCIWWSMVDDGSQEPVLKRIGWFSSLHIRSYSGVFSSYTQERKSSYK